MNKLCALVYDQTGALLRVVVSDDYADEGSLIGAHQQASEGTHFIEPEVFSASSVAELQTIVNQKTGMTPAAPAQVVTDSPPLSAEEQKQADEFAALVDARNAKSK